MALTIDTKKQIGPLDKDAIKKILPHREPILLIDEIISCIPGKYARGRLHLTGQEDFFRGHFPGNPVMPGVLQIEAVAQTGAVAVLSLPELQGRIALFGGATNIRFPRIVRPGDVMEMEIEIIKLSAIAGKGKGCTQVNGEVCSEGEFLFVIPKQEA